MKDGISIRYYQFEPDQVFQEKVRRTLGRVFQSSPSDASLTAWIEKVERYYWAELNIKSQSGVFHSESLGSTAEKALRLAEQKMKRYLHEWRKARFWPAQEGHAPFRNMEGPRWTYPTL